MVRTSVHQRVDFTLSDGTISLIKKIAEKYHMKKSHVVENSVLVYGGMCFGNRNGNKEENAQ